MHMGNRQSRIYLIDSWHNINIFEEYVEILDTKVGYSDVFDFAWLSSLVSKRQCLTSGSYRFVQFG